ncbi:MAG: glycosyltransferase family 39 protein, partial [Anaerolineales bacterium]|nr:glycosyltransferase family 39 protein [Anaerolineales bacterium]
MEKLRRTRPFLLLTLLGLPLITPLLRWTAVPCTHDDHLHYHRIAALRYAWEHGLYFSRWLPDLAFGYGYPFFIYREPAPLYLTLFPHLLGLPLPVASNLFYALTILACGWFMFLWVRDVLDERAALVAAVAYMAAPYVLIDALVRGNSPESLALPLLPLLLWSGRRWLLRPSAASFAISSFGLAFLSLSHNISTFIFAPTLLVYLLALGWQQRLRWRTVLLRVTLLFGLGLSMTLFYTGGALLEMNQVTLQRSTTALNNDFHYNFATLAEIFAPVASEDPLLLNPPLLLRLGWVPTALAMLGIGLTIYDSRLTIAGKVNRQSPSANRQFHAWLMVAGTAVFIIFSLSLSLPLWENLPLIDFIQFPWRFVGRAALPLAFLAGLPFAQRHSDGGNASPFRIPHSAFRIFILTAVALLILESIPNLYPNFCTEENYPTIHTVHRYESETGMVGVDPLGSYFPRTVGTRPSTSPLLADYEAEQTPQRFDTAVLPPQTAVQSITYTKLGATIHLTAPEAFTAQYLTFAFPGWVAEVDGTAVPITPSDPEG